MFSERRIVYVRDQVSKLLSGAALRKIARDPGIVAKHLRQLFLDVNLKRDLFKHADRDAVRSLARLVMPLEKPAVDFDEWLPAPPIGQDTLDLADLFIKHGSDKSTHHDYHRIYGPILSGKRQMPINILEIGLGSNNIDVPSNMGLWGKPGASLRAFRDWAPLSNVFGADVDRRILFEEERISTSWVDQTDTTSLEDLAKRLSGTQFDLIIDDGLHLPHANFNTLFALVPLLAPSGTFVVEDIELNHRGYWTLARSLLSSNFDCCLTEAKGGLVFVLRR